MSKTINDNLTLDIMGGTTSLVDSTAPYFGPNLIGDPIKAYSQLHTRVPWDLIPESHFKGMNFMVNINPDANCDWYTHNTDKHNLVPRLISLIEQARSNNIINKATFVYEYGKFGKQHGKLHFHGLIQTTKKQEFMKLISNKFNNRKNLLHRTCVIKHCKSPDDRNRFINYMKKESQNKIKCLYTTHTIN